MSKVVNFTNVESLVVKQETHFHELAQGHGAVAFKREAYFALQILKQNDFLLGVAANNPDSLKDAILHVATTGLTLNPHEKLAYLVPRKVGDKYRICLDPSYMGICKNATDSQAVMWISAEIVREKDTFIFNGHGKEPTHSFNPFSSDRGKVIGAYCVAKTFTDQYLCTMMSVDEIYAIRNRSESYKAVQSGKAKSSPWTTDEGEMMKKTVIRRASKMWPKNSTRDERLTNTLAVFDDTNAISISSHEQDSLPDPVDMSTEIDEIKTLLVAIDRKEDAYLKHLSRTNRRKIESFDDLTKEEVNKSLIELYSLFKKLENKTQADGSNDVTEPPAENEERTSEEVKE